MNGVDNIFKKEGQTKGKTVAIFGGIHGDERVGVEVIDKLRSELEIDAGTVYLAYGNLQAIKKGARCGEKNLNRCFVRDNKGTLYEEIRAQELMNILDICDGLLDLHSFANPRGDAFAICEENAFDIVKQFDIPVISSGWSKLDAGATDAYMHNQNKVGICLECGPHHKLAESLQRANMAVDVFLKHFGCIDRSVTSDGNVKRHICVQNTIVRETGDFLFDREYKNFDLLEEEKVFATDGNKKHIAKKGDCIILPTPQEPIGGEICLIGHEVDELL